LALWKILKETVARKRRADLFEKNARPGFALDPEPDGRDLVTARDNEIGEVELTVEFERARVDGERTRRGAGLRGLVDDAQLHSELGQPECEDETGGPGADNQDIAPRHVLLHYDVFAEGSSRLQAHLASPRVLRSPIAQLRLKIPAPLGREVEHVPHRIEQVVMTILLPGLRRHVEQL